MQSHFWKVALSSGKTGKSYRLNNEMLWLQESEQMSGSYPIKGFMESFTETNKILLPKLDLSDSNQIKIIKGDNSQAFRLFGFKV